MTLWPLVIRPLSGSRLEIVGLPGFQSECVRLLPVHIRPLIRKVVAVVWHRHNWITALEVSRT